MLRTVVCLVLLAAAAPAAADAPKVVATIKPIQALVAGVMAGLGEPRLLVPPGASEHSFSLKPSDAMALRSADLVFWVGEGLESFMAKPVAALPGRARVVALAEADDMTLLAHREGGAWEAHGDDHEHHEHHGHHGHHGHEEAEDADEADMHLWLDPRNAARIVAVAAEALAAVDPGEAARYAENARALHERLAALDSELDAAFAPVRERPFVVFHDAYQYLERRYGLNAVGSVTVSPERRPSAKRLAEIRHKIVDAQAVCVFSEPQFDAGLVRAAIEGTPARSAALDHLGVDAPPGAEGYFATMRRLAGDLVGCLAGPR